MKMFQVSTLQALMLGYTRSVTHVSELLGHGNIGLGTFTDVDGEIEPDRGIPFSVVCSMEESSPMEFGAMDDIEALKTALNNTIDSHFGLNSMHMARIDGEFEIVDARSESGYASMHVDLKSILGKTQKAFQFEAVKGTLVCVYFPDYMDRINAAGWHLHFISDDRKHGGHVFDIGMKSGRGCISKINSIEIKLPDEPIFDTYSLKQASEKEIKAVEQGKGNA